MAPWSSLNTPLCGRITFLRCLFLSSSRSVAFPSASALVPFRPEARKTIKGGESSSQFRWFTTAKIEL